jgi:phosphate-selective porin OprO/OprP
LRVFANPFINSDNVALRGLGIGLAGTYVDQTGTLAQTLLPSFASPAGLTFFAYRGNNPSTGTAVATNATIADGKRYRYSPQAYYYAGSFGFLAEYINVSQDVSRRATAADPVREGTVDNNAWQVQLTWLATGEEESFKGVNPSAPFTVGGPGWGAFELAARYSALSVDDEAFTGGSASFANPSTSASDAHNIGVAVNWYLNQNLKVILDYEFTRYDGGAPNGGDREDEKALLARFQVAF